MKRNKYLILNPGSTSSKISVFDDEGNRVIEETINHPHEELAKYERIMDQGEYRLRSIEKVLEKAGFRWEELKAVSARGDAIMPLYQGGTYRVSDELCEKTRTTPIEHAANLGAIIARQIADQYGINAYVVDPDCVDEMIPEAKITGLKGVYRRAQWHTLSQKSIGRRLAEDLGRPYKEIRYIVCHIGGGTSVGLHINGRTVDVNNCLEGDGPISPQRAGSIPNISILEMAFDQGMSKADIMKSLVGGGGFVSHLDTNSAIEVERMMTEGNRYAELVYRTMAYQVGKEIGGLAAAAKGELNAIAITGGLAYSNTLITWIKEYISFLAPVYVYPGEKEMEALYLGAKRVENGEEEALEYHDENERSVADAFVM